MKKALVLTWLGLLFFIIAYLFWLTEWKYTQPTPVPLTYQPVATGATIDLGDNIISNTKKPVFIHFFNPDCPCSKFNIPHFRSLVKQYGDKINFQIVVLAKNHSYTTDDIKSKFNLEIPVLFDHSIANRCGVYSTPQAVLIDNSHRLYYRGNYNRSRYCTDKSTNYAQQAIEKLLKNNPSPLFSDNALRAYGCELPNCSR
jgi:hypothetical protein